jgi:pyruvate dehydrogenase E2 component (dihydrolipoamide acetyltransferase)
MGASEVPMPRLSDSMERGTIVHWLRADGEHVSIGDPLVEIETDKATMAYEAQAAGILRILAHVGTTVAVGEPIAHIGEHAAASDAQLSNSAPGDGLAPSPPVPDAALAPSIATSDAKGTVQREPLSPTQNIVARRMVESKATMPEFTVTTDVDVETALTLRDEIRADGFERTPSLGDFVIRACALALREYPRVNSSFQNGVLEIYSRVNVGIAVSAHGALFVPTIFDVDGKSLSEIATEVRSLAKRARASQLTPTDVGGGTFTVSNLGMYDVTHFTAMLNPPQAAILAVGNAEQRVVVHEGQIVARRRMTMTLTCDHRILYGADAAAFLSTVRANIEHAERLVL